MICPVLLSALALPLVAQAQGQAPAPAQAGSAEIRRDPKGITGISPFWEQVKRGDNSYVAKDYDGAIAAYTEAIKHEPQNPLGHYRIGEAYRAKGELDQAQNAWATALRFVANDARLRAKVLFVLADLRERRQQLPEAKDAWSTYEAHLQAQSQAAGYPATPPERKTRIDTWVDMKQKYEAVKQRIMQRLAEMEEKKKKDAK
jgi:tetratricopeptide (TPR) repeat protein